MEHSLDQTVWRRGWNDTTAVWTNWRFFVLDAVVAVVVGSVFQWYYGLGIVVFGMACAWLALTLSAPVKQRNEARKLLAEIPSRRKSIAEKLSELYLAGVQAKQEIVRPDFAGDALAVAGKWTQSVIEYFRANPDELGNSKLLLLAPEYQDWITFGPENSKNTEVEYVHRHLSIELDKMKRLIGELDG